MAMLLAGCPMAIAAEKRCAAHPAAAHYASYSSASLTETSAYCTISIDGATEETAYEPHSSRISACLRSNPLRALNLDAESANQLALTIVPLLVGASVDGFGLRDAPDPTALDPNDLDSCRSLLADPDNFLAAQGLVPYESDLHDEIAAGPAAEIADCLMNPGGSPACAIEDGQLVIRFSTAFGDHQLGLPLGN